MIMRRLFSHLLMVLPMLAFAQSIEVKYSVYSKKRAEAINKIKGAKENQGYQGLLSGLSAEKKDSFCLVVSGRMSSFEQIEPEEELTGDHGPKIILVNPSYESKEIMGLQAYKATIGDSITAWFCPTIPVQDGPGLYCGLPGLILDLEDAQTVYSCTAINTNSTREVGKPKRAKKMTEEEFVSLRRRTIESLKQRSSQ